LVHDPFLSQIAWTGVAIMILVGAASLMSFIKPSGPITELRARGLFAEAFPHRTLDGVWLGADGRAALAKSGGLALIVCLVGETFLVRQIPWGQALSSSFRSGRLCIDLADDAAPVAVISLTAWPPSELAA
jgi:hypothetical protein